MFTDETFPFFGQNVENFDFSPQSRILTKFRFLIKFTLLEFVDFMLLLNIDIIKIESLVNTQNYGQKSKF